MSNWTQPGYDPSKHNWHKGVIDGQPNEGYPNNYFFADSLRNVCIAFGNFFNDLNVIRYDEDGEPIKVINVPLKFGPRSKAHDFRTELESGKKYYIPLPNMTYRITGISYDQERASGSHETRSFYAKFFENMGVDYVLQNQFWGDIQPQPYNITITMEAKTEHLSDAYQIVEQIATRFTPAAFVNIKEFWFANIRRSIKMTMDGTPQVDITQDYGEDDKREITAAFTFTVAAWLYKPIQRSYIIDKIITTVRAKGINGSIDEHEWHNNISGNFNGTFNERYDIENGFGTKIGRVSAVIPELTTNEYNAETSAWVTTYTYQELPDITNYPLRKSLTAAIWNPETKDYDKSYIQDSIRITAVSSVWNQNTSGWDKFTGFDALSGFGKFDSSRSYNTGYKDVYINDEVISAAPFVIETYLSENI